MTPLYVLLGVTATTLLLHVLAGGSPARHWPNALRLGLAAMFILTGVSHFVGLREDLIAIVPPALPAASLLVTVTGVLELAGAAGLLWRRSAALSAAGLTALLVAIFPANVYASVADLQIDGEAAADLPLRAGAQVIYLAAAVAVVITHRHVAGAMRLGRLRHPLSVDLQPPGMDGPAGPQASPGIVLISRLRPHRTLMVHYRHRLSEARFQTLRPGGPPFPSDRPEVRAELARVSVTESASVPARAAAGETR